MKLSIRILAAVMACALLAPPAVIDTPVAAQARPRGYQEPAFARGYADGLERGRSDGRAGKRYDPAAHREYRDADQAFDESYGSRDAYKNNYRAGFRQGYEEGYRANR
jgi:flagellar biosynthesis/type III secretory pathway protein FliH